MNGKGTIKATCGHVLTDREVLGNFIEVKDKDRAGRPCTATLTVCNRCLVVYEHMGVLIRIIQRAGDNR
jgi:hypothetical protein